MAKMLASWSCFILTNAARIALETPVDPWEVDPNAEGSYEPVDSSGSRWPECDRCTGVERECCAKTHGGAWSPMMLEEARCIDPAIDVCVSNGQVCPLSKPFGCCLQTPYSGRCGGDNIECYNPDTHACLSSYNATTGGVGRSTSGMRVVCATGQVGCGGRCMPEGEGLCCDHVWYRSDENKQCCLGGSYYGGGSAGTEAWVCDANQQCMSRDDSEYDAARRSGARCLDP